MKEFHKPWFVALGFMFLIKPGVVSNIPALSAVDIAFDVFRIFLIILTVVALLVKPVKRKDPKMTAMLLIFVAEIWKIIATALEGHSYSGWGALMNTAGIVLFTYTCLIYDQRSFFEGASRTLGLYVIINALTVLLFPDGMYSTTKYTENFFLSYRTAWFPVYLLAATVVLFNAAIYPSKRTKLWRGLTICALFLSVIWVWTATSIFCFTLAAIVFFVCWKFRKGNPVRARWVLLVEAVVFVLMVIMKAQERFSFILVDLLQKDITMTSRLRIWDNALYVVSNNLLTGIGNVGSEAMEMILGYGATHAHNFFLDNTLRYGLIGLIFCLLPVIYTMTRSYKQPMQGLINSCVFVALLTSYQVECYMSIGYYILPIYVVLCSTADIQKRRALR